MIVTISNKEKKASERNDRYMSLWQALSNIYQHFDFLFDQNLHIELCELSNSEFKKYFDLKTLFKDKDTLNTEEIHYLMRNFTKDGRIYLDKIHKFLLEKKSS